MNQQKTHLKKTPQYSGKKGEEENDNTSRIAVKNKIILYI